MFKGRAQRGLCKAVAIESSWSPKVRACSAHVCVAFLRALSCSSCGSSVVVSVIVRRVPSGALTRDGLELLVCGVLRCEASSPLTLARAA